MVRTSTSTGTSTSINKINYLASYRTAPYRVIYGERYLYVRYKIYDHSTLQYFFLTNKIKYSCIQYDMSYDMQE